MNNAKKKEFIFVFGHYHDVVTYLKLRLNEQKTKFLFEFF